MATDSLFPLTSKSRSESVVEGPLLSLLSSINDQRQYSKIPFKMPTLHTDTDYPSASVALDAYIGRHTGDDLSWKMRAKYERELEELLIQDTFVPLSSSILDTSRKKSIPFDLQKYFNIKQLVDMSYERLKQEDDINRAGHSFLVSPMSSHVSPSLSTHQHTDTSLSGQNNGINKTTQNLEASLSPYSGFKQVLPVSHYTVRKKCFDDTSDHHDGVSMVLSSCNSDDVQSGYHSDSSVDFTSKTNSLFLTDRSVLTSDQVSSRSAPQSPHRKINRRYNSCYDSADDTLTQLYSGHKHKNNKVPSWVKDLEESRSTCSSAVRRALRRSPRQDLRHDQSDSSALWLTSPRKQLRFDMDTTEPNNRSDVEISTSPEYVRSSNRRVTNTKLSPEPAKMVGILKPSKMSSPQHGIRRPAEYVSSIRLHSNHSKESIHKRHHRRSLSASGQLCSTPIKPVGAEGGRERPVISSVSSLHSGTNTINSGLNEKDNMAHRVPAGQDRKLDLPSKYLYKAVERAESVSKDLGIFDQVKEKAGSATTKHSSSYTSTSRPWQSRSDGARDLDLQSMKTKHKYYLKELVQDIEDKSSSIGTAFTELQDIIHPDTHACRNLTLPDLSHLGSETTADVWERPWQILPFRKHTSAPDLSSIDDCDTQTGISQAKDDIVDRFLHECGRVHENTNKGLDLAMEGGNPLQPGTMEALKNMLFTMQSITNVDSLLSEGQADKTHISTDDAMSPATKELLESATQHGDSLQRALNHLEKLKLMVKSRSDMKH